MRFSIGVPMLPPSNISYLFFFKTCDKILHVVDFPFVPVITILLENFLIKKIKSISVIILFLYFFNLFLF